MPAIITHGVKDSPHLHPVAVIASFNTEGKIKPLYVQIGETSYKIHSSWAKSSVYHICTFQCEVIDNDRLKSLELSYFSQDNLWCIPKSAVTQ